MSATSVWDAPSGECLRGRGRYGVVSALEALRDALYKYSTTTTTTTTYAKAQQSPLIRSTPIINQTISRVIAKCYSDMVMTGPYLTLTLTLANSLANKTVVQLRPKSTTGSSFFLLEYIRDFCRRV